MAGETKINTITEENKKARTANVIWQHCLEELVASGPIWNFCIKRKALDLDTNTPVYEYSNQFNVPSDSIRLVDVEDDVTYKEEGGYILSNQSSLNCRYLWAQSDATKYTPGFASALSTRLAVDFAIAIAQDTELADKLFGVYELRAARAGSQDAKADTPEDPIIDDWIESRESGSIDNKRTNR